MKAFWRTPLFVLCGAVLILLIANGSRQSFGLFLVPISQDLEWGRTEFAFAIAIQNLVMGLAAPLVAAVADKWFGPIRVMAASAAFYAFGVYMISISGTPETMTVSAGLLVGLGASGIGFTLPLAPGRARRPGTGQEPVARHRHRRRVGRPVRPSRR